MFSPEQQKTLRRISATLEHAERQFEKLVGDIYAGASQRSQFRVGRLASMIQSSSLLEVVAETWVLDSLVLFDASSDGSNPWPETTTLF